MKNGAHTIDYTGSGSFGSSGSILTGNGSLNLGNGTTTPITTTNVSPWHTLYANAAVFAGITTHTPTTD